VEHATRSRVRIAVIVANRRLETASGRKQRACVLLLCTIKRQVDEAQESGKKICRWKLSKLFRLALKPSWSRDSDRSSIIHRRYPVQRVISVTVLRIRISNGEHVAYSIVGVSARLSQLFVQNAKLTLQSLECIDQSFRQKWCQLKQSFFSDNGIVVIGLI
jgi:hypothetical protein